MNHGSMTLCYLGLGSNMGNKHQHMNNAEEFLKEKIGEIVNISNRIQTKAWGNENQDDFLNEVIIIKTSLTIFQMMDEIHQYEKVHRNKKSGEWMPRTIDIDILYYDSDVFLSENVEVPHPFLHERTFVLDSLVELSPMFVHPILKKTQQQLLQSLKKDQ